MSVLHGRRPIDRLAGVPQCRSDEAVRRRAREPTVPALLPRLEEATLRMMGFQPRDQRLRPVATYVLSLSVLDPVILDCPRGRTVFALIWQRDNAGFSMLEGYPRAVQSSLSELAEKFSRDYREASDIVSRIDYHERLEAQYTCPRSWR